MPQPLQKGFGNWLGEVLKQFEDHEFADATGNPRVLSRKLMATFLECDPATIGNYIAHETVPGSDKVALFFATFPPEVVRYAENFLRSLQPDSRSTHRPSVAELTARIVTSVATINEAAAQMPLAGAAEESLREGLLQSTAKVQSQLDELHTAVRRTEQQQSPRMRVAQ